MTKIINDSNAKHIEGEHFDPVVYESLRQGTNNIKAGQYKDIEVVMREVKEKYGF